VPFVKFTVIVFDEVY